MWTWYIVIMQAIDRKCLTSEWIVSQAAKLAPVDPAQLEKCILAFELLGRLADAGIPFIFKGGTAVMLRFGVIRRLSVDVDIACQMPKARLEDKLADIGRRAPFHRWEQRHRRQPPLPRKRHYYFYYRSAISGTEDHVILDILDEVSLYPIVENLTVEMPFFTPDHRIMVPVPTAECLLGDKLTAFAPATVGLPYDPGSPVDLIKQLFDISQLFDTTTDLAVVCDAYARVFTAENGYRRNEFTVEKALDDTYQTAFTLSSIDLTRNIDTDNAKLLLAGVKNIASLLVQSRFSLNEAKAAAGKAALLSRIIHHNRQELKLRDLRFDPANTDYLRTAMIPRPMEYLNKLKGANNEAFHYWHMIQTLFGA